MPVRNSAMTRLTASSMETRGSVVSASRTDTPSSLLSDPLNGQPSCDAPYDAITRDIRRRDRPCASNTYFPIILHSTFSYTPIHYIKFKVKNAEATLYCTNTITTRKLRTKINGILVWLWRFAGNAMTSFQLANCSMFVPRRREMLGRRQKAVVYCRRDIQCRSLRWPHAEIHWQRKVAKTTQKPCLVWICLDT